MPETPKPPLIYLEDLSVGDVFVSKTHALDAEQITEFASQFETMWEVVPEFWGEAPYPNITAVGVTWLYGFQFEIKVIAKVPDAAAA
jgi:enamine deaminase RidA (YjgF/YER057c/UK114 family)